MANSARVVVQVKSGALAPLFCGLDTGGWLDVVVVFWGHDGHNRRATGMQRVLALPLVPPGSLRAAAVVPESQPAMRRLRTCMYTTHPHIHTSTHPHIHTYPHAHSYTHMHTYIYTCHAQAPWRRQTPGLSWMRWGCQKTMDPKHAKQGICSAAQHPRTRPWCVQRTAGCCPGYISSHVLGQVLCPKACRPPAGASNGTASE